MQITTEITSSSIPSDNPIHQRLLYAYTAAQSLVKGNLLEVGCGEGRGIEVLQPHIMSYTAIDKNFALLQRLQAKFPLCKFLEGIVPPFSSIPSDSIDTVIAFQVIEHIPDDRFFVSEMYRVLKPGGIALITTPNKSLSLSRNPWHEREYTPQELDNTLRQTFSKVVINGIGGNQKIWDYYAQNKKAVSRYTRFDIFNLQYKLPNILLRKPYDILNRINRNSLLKKSNQLVSNIGIHDFHIESDPARGLDLFAIAYK